MKISKVFHRGALWGLAALSVCCGICADASKQVTRTRGSFASRGNAEHLSTDQPEVTLSMSNQRDLQDACKYGCEALPCEGGCQSAFAKCNHFVPLCFTNRTEQFFNATVQWGSSNPVACSGGSIACDLWIGALDCNTTASASQVIGTVLVSTDDNQILYEIIDEAYRISSLQVYVGSSEVPLVDGSEYSISPEDFTVQSWFDPKVKGARVDLIKKLTPRMYLIAYASVCPTDSADEIPEVWLPPADSTDPLCPIQAPYLCTEGTPTPAPVVFSSSNLFQSAPSYLPASEPTSVNGGSTSLPPVESTCPFRCGSLSCDGVCSDAFAYCPSAVCLGPDQAGEATWGHSNPINCTGGSVQCELWTGDDCNHTNGELIGHLYIDTDENKVTYDVNNASAWSVSSAHIYVGSSSNFEPFVQDAWFDPNQKNAVVEMYPDIHAGVFVIAQAFVCPSSSASPDLPTNPPNETVLSCPVPRQAPCPSSSPTSALATEPPVISPTGPTTQLIMVPILDSLFESPVQQPQTEPSGAPKPTPTPSDAREPGQPSLNGRPAQVPSRLTMPPAIRATAPPVRPTPAPVRPTPVRPTPQPFRPTFPPTKPVVPRTPGPTPRPTNVRGPTENPASPRTPPIKRPTGLPNMSSPMEQPTATPISILP